MPFSRFVPLFLHYFLKITKTKYFVCIEVPHLEKLEKKKNEERGRSQNAADSFGKEKFV